MCEDCEEYQEDLQRAQEEASWLEGEVTARGDRMLALEALVLELLDKLSPEDWGQMIDSELTEMLAPA